MQLKLCKRIALTQAQQAVSVNHPNSPSIGDNPRKGSPGAPPMGETREVAVA
jgi:hypothetical protein